MDRQTVRQTHVHITIGIVCACARSPNCGHIYICVCMCLSVYNCNAVDKIKFSGLMVISLSWAGNPDFVCLHKFLSNESRCVHFVSVSACTLQCLCVQLTLYFPHNKLLIFFYFILFNLIFCSCMECTLYVSIRTSG